MGISDIIAGFINDLLENEDGRAELQRAELASKFGCVPSQINYVISTRFSPEHGYIVESRRGGNGYIRITKIRVDRCQMLMHIVNSIGDSIDHRSARAYLSSLLNAGVLAQQTADVMAAAVSDNTLRIVPTSIRDALRASLLKQMLLGTTQCACANTDTP